MIKSNFILLKNTRNFYEKVQKTREKWPSRKLLRAFAQGVI